MRNRLKRSPKMEKERSHMTERILNLTLEIIYLLTGENYIAFKLSKGLVASNMRKIQGPVIDPPSHSLKMNKKVQEVTSEIIELLTEEVPIRCQDVTGCISMEEWEYLEGHKDLYKDVMMENRPPLTSPDGSRNRNTPERCPRPLYSRDSTQEHHEILQDDQVSLEEIQTTNCRTDITEEADETYVMDDDACKEEERSLEMSPEPGDTQRDVKTEEEVDLDVKIKEEEIPIEINTDGQYGGNSPISSPGGEIEDGEVTANTLRENPIAPILHPELYTTDLSSVIPLTHEQIPHFLTDPLPPVTLCTDSRGGEMFPCSICGICFTRRAELLSHQRSHTVEKPYSCSECGKCFTQIGNLTVHMKAHTGDKPYSCSECGKCFNKKRNLITHHRIHSGEKPFSCSECGRLFAWRAGLVAHQRTHTGEKPYPCLECGKSFTQKNHLTKHQRTHTGEKPYSCSECGKHFTEKTHVIVHERTHSGVKPYPCTECGKCFNQRSHFIAHQRAHTGEKPHSCAECGKSFTERAQLATHRIIHTDVHPYSCSACGKCYSSKSNLVRHQQVHANRILVLNEGIEFSEKCDVTCPL